VRKPGRFGGDLAQSTTVGATLVAGKVRRVRELRLIALVGPRFGPSGSPSSSSGTTTARCAAAPSGSGWARCGARGRACGSTPWSRAADQPADARRAAGVMP
jgi:hypothetical protein